MTKRFRMIAGPNGSGKSTLSGLLRRDYAVNFYTMLNADDIFAEVSKTHAYLPALPVDGGMANRCGVTQADLTMHCRQRLISRMVISPSWTIRFVSRQGHLLTLIQLLC